MKKYHIFLFLSLFQAFGAGAKEQTSTVGRALYAMPGTEVIPIKDQQNNRQYELYIKLPDAYLQNSDAKYPVIYFTDAVWHIEILSATTAYILDESILVGISWQKDMDEKFVQEEGQDISRARDYTFVQSTNPEVQAKYQLGEADLHLGFIRDSVINYVETNYRTLPGQRTYFGYSLGGMFGAYILLSQPDTFNNYILGSPSLRGRHLEKIQSLASTNKNSLNANVFISYGTLEDELGSNVELFIQSLKDRADKSTALTHKVIAGTHSTAFPGTGVQSVHWLSGLKATEEQ